MVYIGYVYAVLVEAALTVLGAAKPIRLSSRDVAQEVLQQLTLFAEYSAASYCMSNIDSVSTKVTCSAGNCPMVQGADTTTLQEFNEQGEFGDTAGFLAVDNTNRLLVVSFRGSRTLENWIANLDFGYQPISAVCGNCLAHIGFWMAWETVADMVTAQVTSAVAAYPDHTLVFTGHSFGASIATFGATVLRNAGYTIDLYTYGAPRIGDTALAEYITSQGSNYRVTHTDDIVPKLPPRIIGYSHFSPEYWITSGDEAPVSMSDIKVIEEIDSTLGNDGADGGSISAHDWYIVHIDQCR